MVPTFTNNVDTKVRMHTLWSIHVKDQLATKLKSWMNSVSFRFKVASNNIHRLFPGIRHWDASQSNDTTRVQIVVVYRSRQLPNRPMLPFIVLTPSALLMSFSPYHVLFLNFRHSSPVFQKTWQFWSPVEVEVCVLINFANLNDVSPRLGPRLVVDASVGDPPMLQQRHLTAYWQNLLLSIIWIGVWKWRRPREVLIVLVWIRESTKMHLIDTGSMRFIVLMMAKGSSLQAFRSRKHILGTKLNLLLSNWPKCKKQYMWQDDKSRRRW